MLLSSLLSATPRERCTDTRAWDIAPFYDAVSPTSCSLDVGQRVHESRCPREREYTRTPSLPPQKCKRKADMTPALFPARPHPITPPPRALASRVLHARTIPPPVKALQSVRVGAVPPVPPGLSPVAALEPDHDPHVDWPRPAGRSQRIRMGTVPPVPPGLSPVPAGTREVSYQDHRCWLVVQWALHSGRWPAKAPAKALAPRALAVKALAAMAPDAKAALVVDTRRLVELPPFESPHA